MSEEVISFKTVLQFKIRLDKLWIDKRFESKIQSKKITLPPGKIHLPNDLLS